MAWTNPTLRNAGDAILYTDQNIWVNNFRMGQPVFTNEAARDAALTSPEEGMVAYLTAPTVPAATGVITAVPTGVTTVYNGSVWVCTTEVGASSTTTGTTTSTSYVTTLTSDGTAISVTLVTGTTAFVNFGWWGSIAAGSQAATSIAVSGATTLAAGINNSVYMGTGTTNLTSHRAWVLTGLTAGTNTFTLSYTSAGGGNITYAHRWLSVKGVA